MYDIPFHIPFLVSVYLPHMHIGVFTNAYIMKTTRVCTFQIPPSGLAAHNIYLRGMLILVTEVKAYLRKDITFRPITI